MDTEYRPSHTDQTDVMALIDDLEDLFFDCMEDLQPPIHSLPAEVLEEILQRCLPTDHLPTLSSSEAPISLTQVCSLWRNIALSSPTLWTAVHIPIPTSPSEDAQCRAFKNRSAGATWWLAHVRRLNCPLTLSLYWPTHLRRTFGRGEDFARAYTFGRGEDFVRATVIGAASHFIRELDLHLPVDILKMVLNKPTYIFPRLERITLREGSDIEDTCLWETPSLRKVVWNGVRGNILGTQLKWDSMEEISVDGTYQSQSWFNYEDARALLQGTCRSLLKLGILLDDDAGPASMPRRVYSSTLIRAVQSRRADSAPATGDGELYLPRLETLSMVVSTSQPQHSAPRLCKLLQLPALCTLIYTHHPTPSSPQSRIRVLEPHPLFILLSAQSRPVALTTLIIDATSISRTMFLGCVRLTPSLSRLWVKDTRPTMVGGTLVDHGMTMGDTDEEVVLDDLFLGDLLPTFCYDIPIEFSYDYDLLCPLLTDVRFDRAWFTLDALKNFVHTRLSLAAVGAGSVEGWVDDFSEGPQVARLKSVHVGFAYQGARGSNAGLEYELRESNVSVSISFAVEREDAPPAPRLYGVVDPKDGLRAIDEWM